MSKLKCFEHDQRVMRLPSDSIIHRENGSYCMSKSFVMGEKVLFRNTLLSLLHSRILVPNDSISLDRVVS